MTFSDMINSDTLVLVDFYADWSGPNKMMSPILKKFKNEMGDKLHIIKKNADADIKY